LNFACRRIHPFNLKHCEIKAKNAKGSLTEEKRNQEAKLLKNQQEDANFKAQYDEANL